MEELGVDKVRPSFGAEAVVWKISGFEDLGLERASVEDAAGAGMGL